jgi:hypothetical protein
MQRSEPGRQQKKKPEKRRNSDHGVSRTQMKLTIGWLVDLINYAHIKRSCRNSSFT